MLLFFIEKPYQRYTDHRNDLLIALCFNNKNNDTNNIIATLYMFETKYEQKQVKYEIHGEYDLEMQNTQYSTINFKSTLSEKNFKYFKPRSTLHDGILTFILYSKIKNGATVNKIYKIYRRHGREHRNKNNRHGRRKQVDRYRLYERKHICFKYIKRYICIQL